MTDRLKTSDYRDSRLTVSPSISIFSKDPENTEAADLQRKLEMLNNMMDQEARAEQARRQILYNIGHCKYRPNYSLDGWYFIRMLFAARDKRPRSISFLLSGTFARDISKNLLFLLSEEIWFAANPNKWNARVFQERNLYIDPFSLWKSQLYKIKAHILDYFNFSFIQKDLCTIYLFSLPSLPRLIHDALLLLSCAESFMDHYYSRFIWTPRRRDTRREIELSCLDTAVKFISRALIYCSLRHTTLSSTRLTYLQYF